MNLALVIDHSIRDHGVVDSFVHHDKIWKSDAVLGHVQRLAGGFARSLGIGDRVLTLLPNGPNVLLTNLAAWRAGLVVSPLHAGTVSNEVSRIAAQFRANAIVTASSHLETVLAAFTGQPRPRIFVWPDDGAVSTVDGVVSIDASLLSVEPLRDPRNPDPDALAMVLFTGGTTGRPKGVMLSHANLWHSIHAMPRLDRPHTATGLLPMNHVGGIVFPTMRTRFGTRQVFCGVSPTEILQAVERYKIDVVDAVPAQLIALLAYPDAGRYDTSSAKIWIYGGAPLTETQRQQFEERFRCEVHCVWGLTEGAGPLTATQHSPRKKPGSVGRAQPGTKLRIVGADGRDVAPGELGEVWAGGPQIGGGYFEMPDETAQILVDGWLRTGDLGRLDADGDLFLGGRSKDIILRGGENIYPEEIESILTTHPAVLTAAVVGVPNEFLGEEAVAFLVLREQHAGEHERVLDELRATCTANLTRYKIPRFEVVGEMPKTSVGKLDRQRLRELGAQRLDKRRDTPTSLRIRRAPESRRRALLTATVRATIAQILEEPAGGIDLKTGFFELGFSSADAIELAFALGTELGLKLEGTVAFKAPNGDILIDRLLDMMFPKAATVATRTRQWSDEPIAIVGMAFRMPKGIVDDEGLWRALESGLDTTEPMQSQAWRWNEESHAGPHAANFVHDIDKFDAAFFNLPPAEARDMDPQQRILLEVCWNALENAGIPPTTLGGSRTGIYVGVGIADYMYDHLVGNGYGGSTGGMNAVLVGRVSYLLGLRGPSMAMDTACSSSLTSLHLANQALRAGECDLALAGGVSLCISPTFFGALTSLGALTADGRCKSFDASANGYGRSEGCGVVALMRLSDAIARNHTIRAVLRGSAINHDGFSTTLTAPNGASQEEVIRAALVDSKLTPDAVTFVEAHGTGTPTGDPIEVDSLLRVYGPHTGRTDRMYISSSKAIFGHMEFTAGFGGLARVILSLERQQITPMSQLRTVNPMLHLEDGAVTLPIDPVPWRSSRRVAGISSFGLGGSNAHVLVEGAPEVSPRAAVARRPVHVLPLSARSPQALDRMIARYRRHVALYPSISTLDATYTASVGRSHFEHRLAVVIPEGGKLRTVLDQAATGAASVARGIRPASGPGLTAMLFTGQGSQWARMGWDLHQSEPAFRDALDECIARLNPHLPRPLQDILFAEDGSGDAKLLHRTGFTQPALFAIEWALYVLWTGWGVKPDLLMGHSVGEFVAATAAGVFSLEDGCKLIAARGRLMEALPDGGAMASVDTSEADVAELVAQYADRVSFGAINGPSQVVLSGDGKAVAEIVARLGERGIASKSLRVSHAFHSPLMNPMLDEFRRIAETVQYRAPAYQIVSNVTGGVLPDGTVPDAAYWVDHVRAAVRFHDGMQALEALGCRTFIEAGPHPVMIGMARNFLDEQNERERIWIPSLRRNEPAWNVLGASVAAFYAAGNDIAWEAFLADSQGRRIALPGYAFERTRYWVPRKQGDVRAQGGGDEHPLVQSTYPLPIGTQVRAEVGGEASAYLLDHKVYGAPIVPGTGLLELALAAAAEVYGGEPTVLEDVAFEHALALPPRGKRKLSIMLHAPADGAVEFEIHSQADGEGADVTWTLHARGRIQLDSTVAVPPADIAALQARIPQTDPAQLYETYQGLGLEYGPAFQNVKSVGTGEAAREAFGRVELVGAERDLAKRYVIHPALLDSALQVAGGVSAGSMADNTARMPVAVRRVVVARRGVAEGWVHVAQQPVEDADNHDLVVDVQLCDDRGAVAVALEGVTVRKVDQRTLRKVLGLDIRDSMYALGWEVKATEPGDKTEGAHWLVLDAGGVESQEFARALEAAGGRATISNVDLGDPRALDATLRDAGALAGVVFAHALAPDRDGEGDDARAQRDTTSLLQLAQALARLELSPHLVVPCRAAVAVDDGEPVSPARAAVCGMARVVNEEYPDLACVIVHLDVDRVPDRDAAALLAAATTRDGEGEVAYRDGMRFVPRAKRRYDKRLARPGSAFELRSDNIGSLDALALRAIERAEPPAGHVEVAVRCAGLNFRDILMALGMYPGPPQPLGSEALGRVTAVGPGVTDVAVGDDIVLGLVRGAFRSHVIADARYVARVPKGFTDEQIAALPTVFLTAMMALYEIANLQRGERVLIHAGAGGVGLAAIQLARAVGAEVFATAGSARKREYLHGLGVEHVFDSRSLSFAEDVRRVTNNEGVDVVLNSLAGEFIDASLALLRSGGRFLEIGKVRFLQPDEVPEGIMYKAFDLGAECEAGRYSWRDLWTRLCDGLESGLFQPLPVRRFAVDDAVAAFRFLQQGKQIGKVVLAVDETPSVAPRADGTYLVTGGLGSIGRKVTEWLLARGAGHVVVASRRGGTLEGVDPERVSVVAGDVSQTADVARILAEIDAKRPPLRGVFHAAGVLADALIPDQTPASLAKVFAPKVAGAWNLHLATRENKLDMFVLFSSMAALGNAGQANYAAANAFLDGLAASRRVAGLAALTVNWGPWADGGMAANAANEQLQASRGITGIPPKDGLEALDVLISEAADRAIVANIDWKRFTQQPAGRSPVFSRFVVKTVTRADRTSASLRRELAALEPAERAGRIIEILKAEIGQMLGVAADQVRTDVRLGQMGMESLRSLELRNVLKDKFGVAFTSTTVATVGTIELLTDRIVAEIERSASGTPAASDPGAAGAAAEAPPVEGAGTATDGAEIAHDSDYDRAWQLDVGSVRLSVLEWGPETAPAVALVHGFLDQALSWQPLARLLAANGLRAVALDLPGHGTSDHIPGTRGYSVIDAIRAIEALLAKTQARLLVGHSQGGNTAYAMTAIACPANLGGLVLLDAPVSEWRTAGGRANAIRQLLGSAASPTNAVFASETQAIDMMQDNLPRTLTREFVEALARRILQPVDGGVTWRTDPRIKLPLDGIATVGALLDEVSSAPAGVTLPVTAVFVRDSPITTQRCRDALTKVYPEARIVDVEPGHWPHLQRPQEVARMIVELVQQMAPARSAKGGNDAV